MDGARSEGTAAGVADELVVWLEGFPDAVVGFPDAFVGCEAIVEGKLC